MKTFQELLDMAGALHGHLCAGQVLGVRMAQAALRALGVDPDQERKRLIVIVETDRCAADAVAVVARVSLGRRTLKHLDFGKMAATFLDTQTGRAVRVAARESARSGARRYAPANLGSQEAQLIAYQRMPEDELLVLKEVSVSLSAFDLPGPPLRTVLCDRCGEGVNDNREVIRDGVTLCRSCAGEAYYLPGQAARPIPPVVSFVSMSGSGKTTVLEQLVPELAARGMRVGVLKHHAHPTPFDVPGKDTYRLSQAGARVVVGACSVQVAVFRQEDGTRNVDALIARDLADTDLVLAEGFKHGPYPKIEVHRRGHHPALLCEPGELLALVTDEPLDVRAPQFALTDMAGLAAFLCAWAGRTGR